MVISFSFILFLFSYFLSFFLSFFFFSLSLSFCFFSMQMQMQFLFLREPGQTNETNIKIQVTWSEQIVSEFEILLEILVLISHRAGLSPECPFNSCNLESLLNEVKECEYGLPLFPFQRLLATSPHVTTTSIKHLYHLEKRVQFLWTTFFVSICKFPYVVEQKVCREKVIHPLLPNPPCQYEGDEGGQKKDIVDYVGSIKKLDMVKPALESEFEEDADINLPELIYFIFLYCLKCIELNPGYSP